MEAEGTGNHRKCLASSLCELQSHFHHPEIISAWLRNASNLVTAYFESNSRARRSCYLWCQRCNFRNLGGLMIPPSKYNHRPEDATN